MKLLLAILLMLSITGCGVNSSSGASNSAPTAGDSGNNGDDSTDGGDDDNSGDGDTTDPGDTVDPDNGDTTDPGDSGTTDPDPADSIFDTTGDVVYDADSCNANFYRTASDASYNGGGISENGSSFFNVEGQGLQIRSEHLVSDPADASNTWVTLFYKTFPSQSDLGLQGSTTYLMDGFFFLSYDIAWSDESIPGISNTLYVQSAQTTKPSCYRLVLDSVTGQDISVQKVYR